MAEQSQQISVQSLLRILEVSRDFAATNDLDTMLSSVLQAALEVLDADNGSIWLYNKQRQKLELQLPDIHPRIEMDLGVGLAGECLATARIINVADCYADPRFNRDIDRHTGYHTRCSLSLPLMSSDAPVGVLQLLNKRNGEFDTRDEHLGEALAAQGAAALQRAQWELAQREVSRMNQQMALAAELQQATLPTALPQIPGYEFHGEFIPAEHTGGDVYDLVTQDQGVFILLGDATGHGIAPALSATQLQATLRVALRAGASLEDALKHANNQLVEDLPEDRFLTAFVGLLDPQTHRLRYLAPGQGPVLHYQAATGQVKWYEPTSFPMGVLELEQSDPARELLLEPGDVLAVLSDGIYEYTRGDGEQFGAERVAQLIRIGAGDPMVALGGSLLQAIDLFAQGSEQKDDMTIVLVKRQAG